MGFNQLDEKESLMRMIGNIVDHQVKVVSDTNAHTSLSWYCLHFPVETVVASITASDVTNAAGVQTTLPAGTTLFLGTVTAITLTSGVVIGYTH